MIINIHLTTEYICGYGPAYCSSPADWAQKCAFVVKE